MCAVIGVLIGICCEAFGMCGRGPSDCLTQPKGI